MWKWIIAILFILITYSNSVKFGPDNRYTCHCNNDVQCNQETGDCGGDCATGWFGTSCQKQNVAFGKPSSQVETNRDRTSDLAVDGNRSTVNTSCSDTDRGNFTRWWRVDLKDDYPINDIIIFYQSDPSWAAISFTGYSVHVSKENQDPELCYNDTDSNNKPSENNITCDQTLTGRYVNISNLHSKEDSRYLVLCEVEIYVCSVGTFGSDCNNLCHCLNNERCLENGQCTGGCADGWTGTTCSQKCPSGSYGEGCNNQCSVNCKNSADCHHVSGKCTDGCKPGYNDDQCLQKCPSGSYGDGCNNQCSENCKNSTDCHHVSGKCTDGCKPGYKDDQCSQTCDNGMYGAECTKECSKRNCLVETSCNNINGKCEGGCKDGFLGNDCVKACETGMYGPRCTKLCSERNCLDGTSPCNNINGCDEGWYGEGCCKKCSDRKCKNNNVQCDSKTGECIDGCQPGYQSVDCTRDCNNGTYGQDCQFNCSARFCQSPVICSPINGACDCLEGYQGPNCTVKKEAVSGGVEDDEESNNGTPGVTDTTITAVVVSICVVLIVAVVILILIVRRRRRKLPVFDGKSDQGDITNVAVVKPQERPPQGPIYENSDIVREGSAARVAAQPITYVNCNVPNQTTEAQQPPEAQPPPESQQLPEAQKPLLAKKPLVAKKTHIAQQALDTSLVDESGQTNDVSLVSETDQTTGVIPVTKEAEVNPYIMPERSDLNLKQLEEFVKKTKPNDGFDRLYQALPDSFTSSYDVSHLSENRKKNRFKGYYPYDETRVVLEKLSGESFSDFINANYLNGYDGQKFIAAQGATKVTLNDFVRMIWDAKCDKVVMVTREFETGKRKCDRYWPEEGSETFGVIKLTLKKETKRTNFTKRHIIMERDGMTQEFYHFHYISWPDHGVPETNDMLDFQCTVNKFKPKSTSPVLVHCSAGVGRTGTYIAIDYCLKQYKDIGKVDVLECIKTLRQQRKGMVQTASQLQFIHEALIEGIKRGDTALYQDRFDSEYDKQGSDIKIGNMSLKEQFAYLKSVEKNKDAENNKQIISSNSNILRYPSHTIECGIYFEELRNVKPNDIWNGIYQNDVNVAVFILDNTNKIAVCPDVGSEETRGDLVLENKSEENISQELNMATVTVKAEDRPKLDVNALISSVDKSSTKRSIVLYKHIIDIINNLDMYQNDMQPIFLFASDSHYSRIFCILYNILQRIRLDNEVEIFKTVTKMHRHIGKAIKSQEEYNTLHAVVAEFVKSRNTYANVYSVA